jgi:hypothetical protein
MTTFGVLQGMEPSNIGEFNALAAQNIFIAYLATNAL